MALVANPAQRPHQGDVVFDIRVSGTLHQQLMRLLPYIDRTVIQLSTYGGGAAWEPHLVDEIENGFLNKARQEI